MVLHFLKNVSSVLTSESASWRKNSGEAWKVTWDLEGLVGGLLQQPRKPNKALNASGNSGRKEKHEIGDML